MSDDLFRDLQDADLTMTYRRWTPGDPGSVELRLDPYSNIVSEWGVITNPDGNTAAPIGPLILVTDLTARELLRTGPTMDRYGNVGSVRQVAGELFLDLVTTDRTGHRWTWKLFPAHWWDAAARPQNPLLWIGRWMD